MIANINTGASLYGVLAYNKLKVDEGQGKMLFCHKMLMPDHDTKNFNIALCAKSFEPWLDANKRTKSPIFHVSLNPDPRDTISEETMEEIAREYMERLGFGEQPYIVYQHKDIDRKHLHIVSVQVDGTGKKIDYDFYKSTAISRALEVEYGLHTVEKGVSQADSEGMSKVDYSKGNLKRQLSSTVRALKDRYTFSSAGEFNALLNMYNARVETVNGQVKGVNYEGIIYGALNVAWEPQGVPIKSSLIGKDVGAKALQKKYDQGKEMLKTKPQLADQTRAAIISVMGTCRSEDDFVKQLKQENIDVVFRHNSEGRLYGATFVDHNTRSVYNGSRLGKEFSANKFYELFNNLAQISNTDNVLSEPQSKQRLAPTESDESAPHAELSTVTPQIDSKSATSLIGTFTPITDDEPTVRHHASPHTNSSTTDTMIETFDIFSIAMDEAERDTEYEEQQFKVQRKKRQFKW